MPEARIHVSVAPGASANGVTLGEDGNLRLRIAAPAREGKANRELVRYVADLLGVPKSAVRVVRGEGSRHKVIGVTGLDAPDALRRLGAEADR